MITLTHAHPRMPSRNSSRSGAGAGAAAAAAGPVFATTSASDTPRLRGDATRPPARGETGARPPVGVGISAAGGQEFTR